MQMISIVFFLLTALTLCAIAICNRCLKEDRKKAQAAKWILLIASFLFAAYGDLRFAAVLGTMCLVTWLAGRWEKGWKWGIVFALSALGYFKYTNFFLDTLGRLFGREHTALHLLLPLGISFYTFSAISYIVDVHRKKTERRSLPDVALYLSFFPKLTSGPIQRCSDFFLQMDKPRQVGWKSISVGCQIFVFGMFKKLVLADRLSVFVNQVYRSPAFFDGLTLLLAAAAYSLQLYFDFSGYSDMAIGAAEMLDIRLPRNFNLPYLSHNITEFWKRWHMTLSSWLQDYLYIPLGGSRKGKARAYLNLVLTMVIGGLWHGASWNYVLWGLINGLGLVVHKLFSGGRREKKYNLLNNTLSVLATFCFVSVSWVFFRTETLQDAVTVLTRIVSFAPGVRHLYLWLFVILGVYVVCAAVAAVRSRPLRGTQKKKNRSYVEGFYPLLNLDSFWGLTGFLVFAGMTLALAYTGGSPFIYGGY